MRTRSLLTITAIGLAAGLAALELYDEIAVEDRRARGERLKGSLQRALGRAGLRGWVTGLGSILNIHWAVDTPNNARQASDERGHKENNSKKSFQVYP